MIIKVCGMRDADNIREVAKLDIDMMGFVFWKDSPRFVRMISSQAGIIPDYSEERLRRSAGQEVQPLEKPRRVGVFVDEMPQTIVTRVYNYALDYVQLQGAESREMIENLKRTLIPDIAPHIRVIKAISIVSREDLAKCRTYEGVADMFLFVGRCGEAVDSDTCFDWSLLEDYDGQTPFIVGGGIGPDDAERISSIRHPQFVGVDLNSRFETEPGVKDVRKLEDFIARLRQTPSAEA
ncbi:MAG: phosphoribosylanthranilate isomerase [Prevotella sp.]